MILGGHHGSGTMDQRVVRGAFGVLWLWAFQGCRVVLVGAAGRELWPLWSGIFCGGQPWLRVLLLPHLLIVLDLVCGFVGSVVLVSFSFGRYPW